MNKNISILSMVLLTIVCLIGIGFMGYVGYMEFTTYHPNIAELDKYCTLNPNTTDYPKYDEWWHLFGYSNHLSIDCTQQSHT